MHKTEHQTEHHKAYQVDIAIIGGGIAGLWLLNLLRDKGYSACLIESNTLGCGQTLASQGMIHGGIKYALGGMLTDSSETIAAMPERWQNCLDGNGSIDLRGVETRSRDYYLFSDARLTSRVTAFFGSKLVKGRVSQVEPSDAPEAFQDRSFRGLIYKLQDLVLNTSSLVKHLAARFSDCIYTGAYRLNDSQGQITHLELASGEKIIARHYILAAGSGNGDFIQQLELPVNMQTRPLNQVVVTGAALPDLYAHAVTLRSADKPRLTITTHRSGNEVVWYLGGQLAETGVSRSDEKQLAFARDELRELFPWISFKDCRFSCLRIDRAEASQADQSRPDTPFLGCYDNIMVCWPTKLTLVPLLGDMVMEKLGDDEPAIHQPDLGLHAKIGRPRWEANHEA